MGPQKCLRYQGIMWQHYACFRERYAKQEYPKNQAGQDTELQWRFSALMQLINSISGWTGRETGPARQGTQTEADHPRNSRPQLQACSWEGGWVTDVRVPAAKPTARAGLAGAWPVFEDIPVHALPRSPLKWRR